MWLLEAAFKIAHDSLSVWLFLCWLVKSRQHSKRMMRFGITTKSVDRTNQSHTAGLGLVYDLATYTTLSVRLFYLRIATASLSYALLSRLPRNEPASPPQVHEPRTICQQLKQIFKGGSPISLPLFHKPGDSSSSTTSPRDPSRERARVPVSDNS